MTVPQEKIEQMVKTHQLGNHIKTFNQAILYQ